MIRGLDQGNSSCRLLELRESHDVIGVFFSQRYLCTRARTSACFWLWLLQYQKCWEGYLMNTIPILTGACPKVAPATQAVACPSLKQKHIEHFIPTQCPGWCRLVQLDQGSSWWWGRKTFQIEGSRSASSGRIEVMGVRDKSKQQESLLVLGPTVKINFIGLWIIVVEHKKTVC